MSAGSKRSQASIARGVALPCTAARLLGSNARIAACSYNVRVEAPPRPLIGLPIETETLSHGPNLAHPECHLSPWDHRCRDIIGE